MVITALVGSYDRGGASTSSMLATAGRWGTKRLKNLAKNVLNKPLRAAVLLDTLTESRADRDYFGMTRKSSKRRPKRARRARGLRGNGLRGNGLRGNGLRGNGLRGNGLRGNGLRGNGLGSWIKKKWTGRRRRRDTMPEITEPAELAPEMPSSSTVPVWARGGAFVTRRRRRGQGVDGVYPITTTPFIARPTLYGGGGRSLLPPILY